LVTFGELLGADDLDIAVCFGELPADWTGGATFGDRHGQIFGGLQVHGVDVERGRFHNGLCEFNAV
jgi:hypothetical protein